ncbi:MAG: hypothetical protein HYZ14_12865 [Bacteroidetes bacterium]|nr:hypothetical protein [Bacteroidota bacterium]
MQITTNKLIVGIVIVIFIWIGSGIAIHYGTSNRGTFGDMFGAVNALFSGLALFGIIVSILIQQQEMNLQKEELKQTRYEFKINRLTNILFKQTDYLNSQLDKINFVWHLGLGQGTENIGISEFAEKIADFKSKDYDWKKFLKNQERTIDEAITKVHSAFFSFEEISNETDVETTEINKLKKFMRSNINPAIYTLISFKLEIIEKPDSSHTDIKDWQTKLLKLKLERLEYIFNYGK